MGEGGEESKTRTSICFTIKINTSDTPRTITIPGCNLQENSSLDWCCISCPCFAVFVL